MKTFKSNLKRIAKPISDNNGSELIEACAGILALFTVLAMSLSFLPCFIMGQKLQYFATSAVRYAETSGTTEIPQRIDQLIVDTKIKPHAIDWTHTEYIGSGKRVQLNNNIAIHVNTVYELRLFGFIPLNIPLNARASGASEVYYK